MYTSNKKVRIKKEPSSVEDEKTLFRGTTSIRSALLHHALASNQHWSVAVTGLPVPLYFKKSLAFPISSAGKLGDFQHVNGVEAFSQWPHPFCQVQGALTLPSRGVLFIQLSASYTKGVHFVNPLFKKAGNKIIRA